MYVHLAALFVGSALKVSPTTGTFLQAKPSKNLKRQKHTNEIKIAIKAHHHCGDCPEKKTPAQHSMRDNVTWPTRPTAEKQRCRKTNMPSKLVLQASDVSHGVGGVALLAWGKEQALRCGREPVCTVVARSRA